MKIIPVMEIDSRLKFAAMYPLKRAIFPLKGQTEKKKTKIGKSCILRESHVI